MNFITKILSRKAPQPGDAPWQKYLDLTGGDVPVIYRDGRWWTDWDSIPDSFGKTIAMSMTKTLSSLPRLDPSQKTDYAGMFKSCATLKPFSEYREQCTALEKPPSLPTFGEMIDECRELKRPDGF